MASGRGYRPRSGPFEGGPGQEQALLPDRWKAHDGLAAIALAEHRLHDALAPGTMDDAFTDIEFNPEKSFNCQARSCALYVALLKAGILRDAMTDPESFVEVLKDHGYGVEPNQGRLL